MLGVRVRLRVCIVVINLVHEPLISQLQTTLTIVLSLSLSLFVSLSVSLYLDRLFRYIRLIATVSHILNHPPEPCLCFNQNRLLSQTICFPLCSQAFSLSLTQPTQRLAVRHAVLYCLQTSFGHPVHHWTDAGGAWGRRRRRRSDMRPKRRTRRKTLRITGSVTRRRHAPHHAHQLSNQHPRPGPPPPTRRQLRRFASVWGLRATRCQARPQIRLHVTKHGHSLNHPPKLIPHRDRHQVLNAQLVSSVGFDLFFNTALLTFTASARLDATFQAPTVNVASKVITVTPAASCTVSFGLIGLSVAPPEAPHRLKPRTASSPAPPHLVLTSQIGQASALHHFFIFIHFYYSLIGISVFVLFDVIQIEDHQSQ